jgi:hypothetical protein
MFNGAEASAALDQYRLLQSPCRAEFRRRGSPSSDRSSRSPWGKSGRPRWNSAYSARSLPTSSIISARDLTMRSSQVVDQPRSRAGVRFPHEVDPLFHRHELERAPRRHMLREVGDIAFADLIHFAEGIVIVHRRKELLRLFVGDPTRRLVRQRLDRRGEQRPASSVQAPCKRGPKATRWT